MEISRLNHEFTRVLSPIDGQISFYRKTLGNLVNQNETRLTTVVSVDPMYVYFEMDEPTVLRYRRAVNEGKLQAAQGPHEVPVLHGASRRGRLPARGDDQLRRQSGQSDDGQHPGPWRLRQPELKGGHRLLSPGRFARIRLPIGVPHRALLVIDRAIASDHEGRKYVYVLDDDRQSPVAPDHDRRSPGRRLEGDRGRTEAGRLGRERRDTCRSRQGVKITPDRVPMPTLGQPPRCRFSRRQVPSRRSRRALERAETERGSPAMISRFFIDRPIFATVLSVVITLIGGISLATGCRSRSIRGSRRPGCR